MPSQSAIRDFTEDDYPFLSAVDAAAHDDDPRAAELWQHHDSNRDSALFFCRHVVEVGRTPVACGCFGHSDWIDDPDKYWFQILVPRDSRILGIRERYLEHTLEALALRRPKALYSGMVESYEAQIRFLEESGFHEVHREHYSRLGLSGFDRRSFREAVDRVSDQGIELMRLTDFSIGTPDWKEQLHPVYEQLVFDQPAPDPPRLDTLDEWIAGVIGAPDFDPALWIVAVDGESVVGLSQAAMNQAVPTSAYCGLTGVSRPYRRRGIATALKVELLAAVQDRGVMRIDTGNEASNPMYRINLGLGFVPRPDWVMYERRL